MKIVNSTTGAVAEQDRATSLPAALTDDALTLLAAGVPANTRRAYAADRAEWVAYAAERGVPALPAAPEVLADFTAALLTTGSPTSAKPRPLAASSAERRLSAISTMSVEHGHGRPDLRAARLVLRGHRRTAPRRARQAAPMTVPVLRALVAQAAGSEPSSPGEQPRLRSLRDRCLLLLGFAIGARRSELVALDLADLHQEPGGLKVDVLRAKTTDQRSQVVVPWAADATLCPVRATAAYSAALAGRGVRAGPLFRRITRTDAVLAARLTGESVADVIAAHASAAGVPVPDGFGGWSAHSLRRGMATEARRAGADPLRIARQGGWADNSTALASYLADVDRWADHPLAGVL
jgi:integrase